MRLMSASIAATVVITATRASLKPRIAAERPATPSLVLIARSMNAVVRRSRVESVSVAEIKAALSQSRGARIVHQDNSTSALCAIITTYNCIL
jgi:hypothetical protein